MLQVRGSALWARLEWVKHHHGDEGVKSMLPHLSPAGRNLIHAPIDRHAWYNYPLFIELATVIDRLWGQGDFAKNVELGRWGAYKNMPTLYQMFVRFGSVDWVLSKASGLWREHFNAGSFEAHKVAPDRAEGVVEFPKPHLALCYSVLGFSIAAVELSGEKNVRGEIVACKSRGAEECRMRVHWG